MRSRWPLVVVATALVVAYNGTAFGISGNRRLARDASRSSSVPYDGSSDAPTTACSTGRTSQKEPTVAVDPHNTQVVVAGSNDYCAQIVNGEVWVGYYRSIDGGSTWQ